MQSSMERPCPGERVIFTCTVSSRTHRWEASALSLPRPIGVLDQGSIISDPPFQFNVTEVTASNITSTAIVTATADLNGTLVLCQDNDGILPIQSSTITIIGEYCNVYPYK